MPPDSARRRVVVWRVGDALLAAPVDAVVEIAAVDAAGTVRSRVGALDPRTPPGLEPPEAPVRAVVLRAGGGHLAMAADHVDGVTAWEPGATAPTPDWLRSLPTGHVASLIRLDQDRVAALLAVDALADL